MTMIDLLTCRSDSSGKSPSMERWRSNAVARSSKRVLGNSSRSAVTRPRWRWASSGNAPRGIAPTSGGRSAARSDSASHAAWRSEPQWFATMPANRISGAKPVNPLTRAAMLRPIPWTFTTRRTGASSQRAISAVLPSSVAGSAPSKSPITPSTRAQSAFAVARSKRPRTWSFPAIQPSRL